MMPCLGEFLALARDFPHPQSFAGPRAPDLHGILVGDGLASPKGTLQRFSSVNWTGFSMLTEIVNPVIQLQEA